METQYNTVNKSPVQVTYLDRIKKKQGSISCTEGLSDSELNNTGTMPYALSLSGHKRSLSSMSPPLSKGPKRIEVHLPGPLPKKRSRRDSDDTLDNSSAPLHCRTASISLVDLVPCQGNSSAATAHPMERPVMSDADQDDSISIAESSKGITRTRRTVQERIQIFTEHPECGFMEPHRVLCVKCDKWVNLGRRQTYAIRPWVRHRERCDKLAQPTHTPAIFRLDMTPKVGHARGESDDSEDDASSTVAPSVAQSEISVRRTKSERQAFLESDPRAEEVKPTEVRCKKCQKWIGLTRRFVLRNWNAHQQRCSGSLPNGRVATAERKLRIMKDPLAGAFTAHSVECAACGLKIQLDGKVDFELTKWEAHKLHCSSPPHFSPTAPHNNTKPNHESDTTRPIPSNRDPGPVLSTSTSQPPLSSASTDSTLIASDRSCATRQALKRSSEAGDEETRPQKRARADNYKPDDKVSPGPFGWFLLPFKTFVRGFREGLQS